MTPSDGSRPHVQTSNLDGLDSRWKTFFLKNRLNEWKLVERLLNHILECPRFFNVFLRDQLPSQWQIQGVRWVQMNHLLKGKVEGVSNGVGGGSVGGERRERGSTKGQAWDKGKGVLGRSR